MAGPEGRGGGLCVLADTQNSTGDLPIGSNAFAVSPARSTDGATQVLASKLPPA